MSIIKVIKKQMVNLCITEKQLSYHIQKPENIVKSWLSGKSKVPYMYLWRIMDLLSIDQDDSLNYKISKRSCK